jgi:gliding motility-associated-like protein
VSLLISLFLVSTFCTGAQECPPNIDFEKGTFDGWTPLIGSVSAVGGQNIFTLSPSNWTIPGRHTIFAAGTSEVDPYGSFPVSCPNGSGYSIRLGNDEGGGQAEGIEYEFTIPAGRNEYSLIYHYAVVFQDPKHAIHQQPRMDIEITNVTDGTKIECSSFSFTPFGTPLPGFVQSPIEKDSTAVWYKPWSAVSISLDSLAGKTIRLLFKTGDCTFQKHFGYAYIDVNSECSSVFTGATYCKDDTLVNLTAPFGYQSYRWFNDDFSRVIGNTQTLSIYPAPPSGTIVAVEVVPYDGYGCLDTLYARLIDTLTIIANAGSDILYCNTPVTIGANPKPGQVYSWAPPGHLSNTQISNPQASPDVTTQYVLTVRHDGGGCLATDSVIVQSFPIDTSLIVLGREKYCLGTGDSAVLRVRPTDSIQWFRDGRPIPGANSLFYRPTGSGVYHALLFNAVGCSRPTLPKTIVVDKATPGVRYPTYYAAIDLPGTLTARPVGDTVLWNPGSFLNNPRIFTPLFSGFNDQEYIIRLTTSSGCVTVDTQLVKTMKRADIYVPTAFTPNGDGRNDQLKPLLAGMKELRYFRIYNRWGELFFQTSAQNTGWDGRIKGYDQPTQAVVWIAEAIGLDGRIYTRKGTTVIVR